MVDQPARADRFLAKATFNFCHVKHRIKEVDCRGVILLGGRTRERFDPMSFCLVGGQSRGRELVIAELAGEHLMDGSSVLRKLQLPSKHLLALLTPDVSVRRSHVVLHLSDVLKHSVTRETVRRTMAYDSMDESGVLVVKPVVAVLAFCCSSNPLLSHSTTLFFSSSIIVIVSISDQLNLDRDLSNDRPLSLLQLHNRLENIALAALPAVLVRLDQVAALAQLVHQVLLQAADLRIKVVLGRANGWFVKITSSQQGGQHVWIVSVFSAADCFDFVRLFLTDPRPPFFGFFKSILSLDYFSASATYVETRYWVDQLMLQ